MISKMLHCSLQSRYSPFYYRGVLFLQFAFLAVRSIQEDVPSLLTKFHDEDRNCQGPRTINYWRKIDYSVKADGASNWAIPYNRYRRNKNT